MPQGGIFLILENFLFQTRGEDDDFHTRPMFVDPTEIVMHFEQQQHHKSVAPSTGDNICFIGRKAAPLSNSVRFTHVQPSIAEGDFVSLSLPFLPSYVRENSIWWIMATMMDRHYRISEALSLHFFVSFTASFYVASSLQAENCFDSRREVHCQAKKLKRVIIKGIYAPFTSVLSISSPRFNQNDIRSAKIKSMPNANGLQKRPWQYKKWDSTHFIIYGIPMQRKI